MSFYLLSFLKSNWELKYKLPLTLFFYCKMRAMSIITCCSNNENNYLKQHL